MVTDNLEEVMGARDLSFPRFSVTGGFQRFSEGFQRFSEGFQRFSEGFQRFSGTASFKISENL